MQKLTIRHALPDRVRLAVPGLRYNREQALRLEQRAKEAPGILWARANAACGSLAVRFDARVHTPVQVAEIFRRMMATGE